jgi:microcystin-dependent protein
MSDPFLAELRLSGFNFPPRGWAFCDGQLLPINQNQALFALLGTVYGGNGLTTFALPDLRGRVPVGFGSGPGLSERTLGEVGGHETVTLASNQLPAHSHALTATTDLASDSSPAGGLLAGGGSYGPPGSALVELATGAIGASGGDQPHDNMQPYLVLNWIIALVGIFPSRN